MRCTDRHHTQWSVRRVQWVCNPRRKRQATQSKGGRHAESNNMVIGRCGSFFSLPHRSPISWVAACLRTLCPALAGGQVVLPTYTTAYRRCASSSRFGRRLRGNTPSGQICTFAWQPQHAENLKSAPKSS